MSERAQPGATREPVEASSSGAVAAGPTMVGPAIDPMVTTIDTLVGPATESPRFAARESPGFGPWTTHEIRHSIELHIDELVLHGFAPAQRYAIGDAMERELARLFSEQGWPMAATEDIEIAAVEGGVIHLQPSGSDEASGRQLARAIYGGLRR